MSNTNEPTRDVSHVGVRKDEYGQEITCEECDCGPATHEVDWTDGTPEGWGASYDCAYCVSKVHLLPETR